MSIIITLCWGKARLAGPAAAIFGPVKEWPSQIKKKIGWANYGWEIFWLGQSKAQP